MGILAYRRSKERASPVESPEALRSRDGATGTIAAPKKTSRASTADPREADANQFLNSKGTFHECREHHGFSGRRPSPVQRTAGRPPPTLCSLCPPSPCPCLLL